MNSLILFLAVIAQWDMRPVESRWAMTPPASTHVRAVSWSMAPAALSTADIARQTGKSTVASPATVKPVLDLFAPYWSSRSAKAIEDIRQMEADFTVIVHADDTRFPQWIRDRASTKEGGGYPLVWYAAKDGKAKVMTWSGTSDFCRAYETTTAPAPVIAQRQGGYPVHRQRWNIEGDWNPTRERLIEHLSAGQLHAGKWDLSWLNALSREELLSLHDDDHEDRVRWEYVRSGSPSGTPAVASPVIATAAPVQRVLSSTCPGGFCPTSQVRRRGLFSRWPL